MNVRRTGENDNSVKFVCMVMDMDQRVYMSGLHESIFVNEYQVTIPCLIAGIETQYITIWNKKGSSSCGVKNSENADRILGSSGVRFHLAVDDV